jgi:hypothetical protein
MLPNHQRAIIAPLEYCWLAESGKLIIQTERDTRVETEWQNNYNGVAT